MLKINVQTQIHARTMDVSILASIYQSVQIMNVKTMNVLINLIALTKTLVLIIQIVQMNLNVQITYVPIQNVTTIIVLIQILAMTLIV
ncbi:MAG: hypothetical protein PHI40_05025 [Caldisericia bacterium]|nr:hypothetical protein [Caldisericia bacterium]MDD4614755.1 hypothetical protein [Caldisericia bacterium]